MNKIYIAPAISVVNTIMESHILSGSLKISSEEVSEGWAKENDVDWDIWGENEE